jgi:hypothetical protein
MRHERFHDPAVALGVSVFRAGTVEGQALAEALVAVEQRDHQVVAMTGALDEVAHDRLPGPSEQRRRMEAEGPPRRAQHCRNHRVVPVDLLPVENRLGGFVP